MYVSRRTLAMRPDNSSLTAAEGLLQQSADLYRAAGDAKEANWEQTRSEVVHNIIVAEAGLEKGREWMSQGCLDKASEELWAAEAELEAALKMEGMYWIH